jgi:ketosteroid isomerase-like protein
MSEDNVQIIESLQRGFDAYSRGDFDAAIENFHPEIELAPAGRQPMIRGAGAIRAWMEPDAFESQVVEPLEFRVAGNKVLVRHRSKIRGAGSGIEADFVNWSVCTFNEAGLVTRYEIFLPNQEAEALEAAGLGEYDLQAAMKRCKKKFPKGPKRKKCIKKAKARAGG